MDWAASAIKPGRRSLNRTSMDGRRARDAIKDPSGTKSDAMCLVDRRHTYSLYTFYFTIAHLLILLLTFYIPSHYLLFFGLPLAAL